MNPRDTPDDMSALWIGFGLLIVLVGLITHGGPAIYDDAGIDWVVVEAAWTSIDPYQPLPELYESLGMAGEGKVQYAPQPRPPAAFIVQAPITLVPIQYAFAVNLILGAAAITYICRVSRAGWWSLAVLFSAPVLTALFFGNIVFIYLGLIVWSLRGSEWWRGVGLGVAAAVRLWPALIIVALWVEGRRRAAAVAAALAIGLNAAGLSLVSLGGAVDGLVGGQNWWGMDASLPGPGWIWPPVALILVFVWRRIDVAVPLGVLASPISWPSYYLAALPQIVQYRMWGPALLIGVSSWFGRWLAVLGGLWIVVELVRVNAQRPANPGP